MSLQYVYATYENLARLGPGDEASTLKAFEMAANLPERPDVLDIGCGTGAQTLILAAKTGGRIFALDNHGPFLETVKRRARESGVGDRVQTTRATMDVLPFPPEAFDLIWAEGSIYNIGFERGLKEWNSLIRSGGYLAATEACWLVDDPPPEVRAFWEAEYPAITTVQRNLAKAASAGYRIAGYFSLPASAWLEEYYVPLESRIAELEARYRDVAEAMAVFGQIRYEIFMYRTFPGTYGYVFFVLRKP